MLARETPRTKRKLAKKRAQAKAGDTPVTRAELRRVEEFKDTSRYRGAVRAAQDTQAPAARAERTRRAVKRVKADAKKGRPVLAEDLVRIHANRARDRAHLLDRKESTWTGVTDRDLTRAKVGREVDEARQRRGTFTGMTQEDRDEVLRYQLLDERGELDPKKAHDLAKRSQRGAERGAAAARVAEEILEKAGPGTHVGREQAAGVARLSKEVQEAGFKNFKAQYGGLAVDEKTLRGMWDAAAHKKSPALFILEQFTRPSSALAGGAREVVKQAKSGKVDPTRIVERAGRGFTKNDESFQRVLEEAGVKGRGVGTAGLVLDIGLDPLTYLTFGASAPANAAAKTAMRAAKAAGKSESEAMKIGKRVYDTRASHGDWASIKDDLLKMGADEKVVREISKGAGLTRKGIQPGFRLGAPTKTGRIHRATSKMRRDKPVVSDVDGAAESFKRGLAYAHRPADIHPLEWEVIRRAGRTARTSRGRGERAARSRIQAYMKTMKKAKLDEATTIPQIARALEANDLSLVPEGPARKLAATIQADLKSMADSEVAAGIRGAFEVIGKGAEPEILPVTANVQAAIENARKLTKEHRRGESTLFRKKVEIERERINAQVAAKGLDPKTGEVTQRMVDSLAAYADETASRAAVAKSEARNAERNLQRAKGAAGAARVSSSPTKARVAELRAAADDAAATAAAARRAHLAAKSKTSRAQGRAERSSRADELAMKKGELDAAKRGTVEDLEELAALRLLREPEAADLAKAKGAEASAAEKAATAAERAQANAEEFGRRLEKVDRSLLALKGDKTWPELKADLDAEITGIGQQVAHADDTVKAMEKMASGKKLTDKDSMLIAAAAQQKRTIDDFRQEADNYSRLLSQRQAQLREATETFGGAAGRAAVAADEAAVTKGAAEKASKTKTQQEKVRLHQGRRAQARSEYDEIREVTSASAKAAREAQSNVPKVRKEKKAQERASAESARRHAEWMQKPEGYFPRMLTQKAEKAAEEGRPAVRSPGQITATVTSKHGRKDTRALAHMEPDKAERYITDSVVPLAQRMLDTGHGLSRVEFLRALEPVMKRVDELDDPLGRVRAGHQDFMFFADGKLKPVFREVDTHDQATAKLQKAMASGQDVRYIPRRLMDEAISQAERGRVSRGADHPVLSGYDAVQGFIKTWQTVPNPGYHMTNLIGDMWNARLGGARGSDLKAAIRQLKVRNKGEKLNRDLAHGLTFDPPAAEFNAGGKPRAYGKDPATGEPRMLTDAQVVMYAQQHGAIQMGFAGQELRQLLDPLRKGGGGKAAEKVRTFNEAREDLIRLASFTRALKQGLDFDEAAAKTNRHHFDYSDLTEAERGAFRRLIPFYTFMARNLPLQARSLAQSPGRFANVEKVRDQSAEAAGLDEDFAERLQTWQQRAVPFGLPGQKMDGLPVGVAPKLPLTDLNILTASPSKQWQELLQRMTPIAKIPFEQGEKYSTFFHSPITKELVPAPDVMQDILGKGIVKDIYDRRTGEMKPGWNWRIDQLLRTLPLPGLVSNISSSGRERYEGQDKVALLNYLTGPRRFPVDFNAAEVSAAYEKIKNLDRTIEQLKQRVPAGQRPGERGRWGGKIRELMDEKTALEQRIRELDELAGSKDPRGRPKKKGRQSRKRSGASLGGGGLTGGLGGTGLGSF